MTPIEEADIRAHIECRDNSTMADLTARQVRLILADRDRLAERVDELEQRLRMEQECHQQAVDSLATAEADKEALVKTIAECADVLKPYCNLDDEYQTMMEAVCQTLLDTAKADHPGTALTQRLAEMDEALKDAYGLLARIVVDAKESRPALLEDGREWAKLFVTHNLIKEADRMTSDKQALDGKGQ